jgi:hypothetical protein
MREKMSFPLFLERHFFQKLIFSHFVDINFDGDVNIKKKIIFHRQYGHMAVVPQELDNRILDIIH